MSNSSPPARAPRYRRGVLYLGRRVILRLRGECANEQLVLSAFQDDDWVSEIFDALPKRTEGRRPGVEGVTSLATRGRSCRA